MDPLKESLYDTIALLNNEEIRQLLEFAQSLRREGESLDTLKRLIDDPTFKVPSATGGVFRLVEPIQGKGITASKLLVEDRR